jgi:16S rRNA (guanine527-N7)-methyltransferase
MPTSIPAPPTSETIRRALGEFQLSPNEQQVVQIQQYIRLLLTWNEKINLTAIRDPLEILYRHFCESMYAAKAVPVENGRLADVGSGGGFPGIPLKILRPGLNLFLIESNVKKATFLAEVIRDLELTDARVLVNRYQELSEGSQRIASKQVILWIGERDLKEVQSVSSWDWQDPIPVPHSLRRLLVVGTKKVPSVGPST